MECEFFVGQKVVFCGPEFKPPHGETVPVVEQVYTVREVLALEDRISIRLMEIENAPLRYIGGFYECAFEHIYFRPAFDLSIFHKLVEEARKTKRVTVEA